MGTLRGAVLAVLGATLAWSPLATAAEGLQWGWSAGESHRYFISADVQTPYLLPFNAQTNSNLRVAKFVILLNTNCIHVKDFGKKAFEIECSIDDVRIVARTTVSDSDRGLVEILDEIDDGYLESRLQVVMGRDGYVRSVSLDGVNDRLRRMREMEETMRLMVVRAFAGVDLGLPPKGNDGGTVWASKKALVLQLPSKFGSFGTSTIDNRVTEVKGSLVTIETVGRGTIASGESAVISTPEGAAVDRPRDTFDIVVEGVAVFDTQAGVLVERVVTASGTATASSQTAVAGEGVPYLQLIKVQLADDKEIPAFAGNGEI
ncbi:MAG: hypothetical protein ACI8PZ_007138 [Myxococcota bacterium]|jgi:hypothetical protein